MNLTMGIEQFELAQPFVIARGAIDRVALVVVEVTVDGVTGRGEGAPQAFMSQSPEGDLRLLEELRTPLEPGMDRNELARALPAGSARNAVDCALWDLEAKLCNRSIWDLLGLRAPGVPLTGMMTISLGSSEETGRRAASLTDCELLKVKLDGARVAERIHAVRAAAPKSRLTVDVNEGWTFDQLREYAPLLASLGVEMLEQPLPRGCDDALVGYASPLPLAADESCHTTDDLDWLEGRYQIVNIKLDKTGGLTEALRLVQQASRRGFRLMTGCNVATSLSMAPAYVVAALSEYRDLDGPTMLRRDRSHGLRIERGLIHPLERSLWG